VPAGAADPQALLAADREFSRLSAERGSGPAFAAWLADDAIELPEGANPIVGRAAIVRSMDEPPPGTTESLVWTPEAASVAASGDLGWTWGRFTLELHAADGRTTTAKGKYVSAWRREKTGRWRVVLDMGNSDPKPRNEGATKN
jgi:ketosteroid isomerase-like protein